MQCFILLGFFNSILWPHYQIQAIVLTARFYLTMFPLEVYPSTHVRNKAKVSWADIIETFRLKAETFFSPKITTVGNTNTKLKLLGFF